MSRSAKNSRVGFRLLWMTTILVYGVIKETTTAPSSPSECEQPETISDHCCGTYPIDRSQQCCSPGNHRHFDRLEPKEPKMAYINTEDCCGGEVVGKGTECCNNVKMNNATHMCCEGEPTARVRDEDARVEDARVEDDKCCVSIDGQMRTTFNDKTHFCCDGEAIKLERGKERCECAQYFTTEQLCCFGTLRPRKSNGTGGAEMECCGNSIRTYNPETETCCPNSGLVYQGPQRNHMCGNGQAEPCDRCGGDCYDKKTNTCCRDRLRPAGHQCKPPKSKKCPIINLSELKGDTKQLCSSDMAIVATKHGSDLMFDTDGPIWVTPENRLEVPTVAGTKTKPCRFPRHSVALLKRGKSGQFRVKLIVVGKLERTKKFIERNSASACGRRIRTPRNRDERVIV